MPVEGEGPANYLRFVRIIFVIQLALGIAQLICGGMGVKYTKGQTDTFGAPYFTGAFIVGVLIFLAGLISLMLYRKANSLDTTNQGEMRDIACFMCAELGLCVATCMGSFIGVFFVALFGLQDCDPDSFGSTCNYTGNFSENKTVAGFILLFILASAGVSIVNICCSCRYGQQFGINMNQRGRPLAIVGGNQGVATYQTTSAPVVTDTGYKYAPVVIGGATPNTASQPSQYPMGPAPYTASQPSQYPPAATSQPYSTNQTVQELQEQNRLLQEQIRLQQQQLELQRQLQQTGQGPPTATPMYTPPPPSYEQVTSDEATIRLLEEQNQALRQNYEQQQQVLEKQYPPPGPGHEPSAPPE